MTKILEEVGFSTEMYVSEYELGEVAQIPRAQDHEHLPSLAQTKTKNTKIHKEKELRAAAQRQIQMAIFL